MRLSASPPLFGVALEARTLVEYLVYAGAIILVTVLVTLWLMTLRQPPLKNPQRQRRQRSSRRGLAAWFKGGTGDDAGGQRRKRRSRRRQGPTLAETGGLPPIRNQPPSTPGAPPP